MNRSYKKYFSRKALLAGLTLWSVASIVLAIYVSVWEQLHDINRYYYGVTEGFMKPLPDGAVLFYWTVVFPQDFFDLLFDFGRLFIFLIPIGYILVMIFDHFRQKARYCHEIDSLKP